MIPIKVLSMDQVDMFKIICIRWEYLIPYICKLFVSIRVIWSSHWLIRVIFSFLKPYNYVQTNNYYFMKSVEFNLFGRVEIFYRFGKVLAKNSNSSV